MKLEIQDLPSPSLDPPLRNASKDYDYNERVFVFLYVLFR